jgi:oligopeptide transport system substrate-binding protein
VTLVVELEAPAAYFLYILAHHATFPVPRHAIQSHGAAWTAVDHLVSNGPFRLAQWQPGESMIFTRNPTYHGRFTGNVEQVRVWAVDWRRGDQLARYANYELDCVNLWLYPAAAKEQLARQYAGEYLALPALLTDYLSLDVSRAPFRDLRVRRALALAIDRETLISTVLRGNDAPATGGFIPPGMPGHSAGIGLPYDPTQAQRLLAAAGYAQGQNFPPVVALAPSANEALTDYLSRQWQINLGIEIAWQPVNDDDYYARLRSEPPHIHLFGWGADYPDPDNFLRASRHERAGRYEAAEWRSQRYIDLVEQARRATDQEERLALYRQADQILVTEAAIIPLYYGYYHFLLKPSVKKRSMSSIRQWFWQDIVVESSTPSD